MLTSRANVAPEAEKRTKELKAEAEGKYHESTDHYMLTDI